jgi:hypothetical protein
MKSFASQWPWSLAHQVSFSPDTLNLTSTRAPSSFNFGWIGMGFGQQMVGSPMVIVVSLER